jgi:hypothetical protein
MYAGEIDATIRVEASKGPSPVEQVVALFLFARTG